MVLKFLGNGSGFTNSHTGAYFINNKTICFFDCSMLNIDKMLSLKPYEYDKCVIFITHMHDDHVSGLTLFLQYMYFKYNTCTYICVPKRLLSDIKKDFKIKGIPNNLYKIIDTNNINLKNFNCIKTTHALDLNGKCFGYSMDIKGKHIVYSGDTNTLEPYKKYITKGCEFYVDVSVSYNGVHLHFDECKEDLICLSNICDIYIMHMDDINQMKKNILNTNINIAKISK